MVHEDYKMMLPMHALASLDGDEAQALDQHLATCAECRAELDDWQDAAGALAYAAEPLEPSPQVRTRILESVRAESARQPDNVIPLKRPASIKAQPGWSRSLQAIAALIIIGLIIGVVVLWRQNQDARASIARLAEQWQESITRLERERAALQVFSAPGARMAELAGMKEAPNAHAMVAVDSKTRRVALMVQGLPQAPAGKAYQFWFIPGAKPMPGKVFKTDSSGSAMMMDEQVSPEALASGTFAVTLEPELGVPLPTGPMYLLTPAKPS